MHPKILSLILLSFILILESGCSDDTGKEQSDLSEIQDQSPEDQTLVDQNDIQEVIEDTNAEENWTSQIPNGHYLVEPEAMEFPDCITEEACTNPADGEASTPKLLIQTRTFNYDGIAGLIDGKCHDITINGNPSKGPDTDIFSIQTGVREMIDIRVTPLSSGLWPVIYTAENNGGVLMTYGAGEKSGDPARTMLAFPHTQSFFIRVYVQDVRNDEILSNAEFPFDNCTEFVGGQDFGYLMTIQTSPFAPTEIQSLGTTLSNEKLSEPGDIKYYRFYALGQTSPQIHLKVSSGSNAEFQPTLVAMNTIAGQLGWNKVIYDGGDGARDGELFLTSGFEPCPEGDQTCLSQNAEFVFAVLDWNGKGGDDFEYELQVSE